jgi:chromosome segregation ATPase
MEADESSVVLENTRITGLESQILNSQEIIVRLNRELDSALLRITTLENVCSENQTDLHEKRSRIKELNDEVNEREEINERLIQELSEKDERLSTLDDLITQLKQHIKQAKQENEETDENINGEVEDSSENSRSQILFDRQLRELILHDDENSSNSSPQAIIDQYQNNQRLKFHNLLEKSLTIDDMSNLIDSDDVLFEILTHLNSLMRLKETLSRDSMKLQHIYSLLHLTNENNDEVIEDLINKRECLEYLRAKVDDNQDLTDFDLIKHVLHDYFNYQQQQIELKEYFDSTDDLNYSGLLIERCTEAIHVRTFFICVIHNLFLI